MRLAYLSSAISIRALAITTAPVRGHRPQRCYDVAPQKLFPFSLHCSKNFAQGTLPYTAWSRDNSLHAETTWASWAARHCGGLKAKAVRLCGGVLRKNVVCGHPGRFARP